MDQSLLSAACDDVARRQPALFHLQAFLANGGNPNRSIDRGEQLGRVPLLIASIIAGWEDAVRTLLAAGADVHMEDDRPLCAAAVNGRPALVAALLIAGADVHANSDYPLLWAAEHRHLQVVECLFAAGADAMKAIDQTNGSSRTRLLNALDAVAPAIPAAQRRALLRRAPSALPALVALAAATRRQETASPFGGRNAGTIHNTPPPSGPPQPSRHTGLPAAPTGLGWRRARNPVQR